MKNITLHYYGNSFMNLNTDSCTRELNELEKTVLKGYKRIPQRERKFENVSPKGSERATVYIMIYRGEYLEPTKAVYARYYKANDHKRVRKAG